MDEAQTALIDKRLIMTGAHRPFFSIDNNTTLFSLWPSIALCVLERQMMSRVQREARLRVAVVVS